MELLASINAQPESDLLPNASKAYPELVACLKAQHEDVVQKAAIENMTKDIENQLGDIAEGTAH